MLIVRVFDYFLLISMKDLIGASCLQQGQWESRAPIGSYYGTQRNLLPMVYCPSYGDGLDI